MKGSLRTAVFIILRTGFGLMLVYSSFAKIADPFGFSVTVSNYRVIGIDPSRFVAVILPFLELATGLLLTAGVWTGAAAVLNATMMCGFLILVSQAFIRGLDISCGCFHLDEGKISAGKLIFNLLLATASLWLLQLTRAKGKG
ncbi:DoxX family membrane protein [bacterium]|nr:DoxX family membrane protein [bacterium]